MTLKVIGQYLAVEKITGSPTVNGLQRHARDEISSSLTENLKAGLVQLHLFISIGGTVEAILNSKNKNQQQ